MFLNRQRLAVFGDFTDGDTHLAGQNGAGSPPGCNAGGTPQIALSNPNAEVFFEGLPVLVLGTVFDPHTNKGTGGCATGHVTAAIPLSDPFSLNGPDDLLVKVNGILPIRVGDLLSCGDQIKPLAGI
jgi:hypothetical protein